MLCEKKILLSQKQIMVILKKILKQFIENSKL